MANPSVIVYGAQCSTSRQAPRIMKRLGLNRIEEAPPYAKDWEMEGTLYLLEHIPLHYPHELRVYNFYEVL